MQALFKNLIQGKAKRKFLGLTIKLIETDYDAHIHMLIISTLSLT